MKRILDGMQKTMMAVKPPRYTALEGLHQAETANPFKILIGTVLSARTKDENTTKAVTQLFKVYNTPQKLAKAKVKDVEKIIKALKDSINVVSSSFSKSKEKKKFKIR